MIREFRDEIYDADQGIGIVIPISNGKTFFDLTRTTKANARAKLINLLLTASGERVFNSFGTEIPKLLFSQIETNILTRIKDEITEKVRRYIPEIKLTAVKLSPSENQVNISISYSVLSSPEIDTLQIRI